MNQKEMIENLISYWKEHKIFQKSIDQRSDKLQSITYDGPPFASGTPHFGHGLVSVMKDSIWRYKAMKWYKVIRDRWWDCHGLPVEKAVEKHLWIDGKKDIEEKLWVEKFTEECRKYVSNVNDEWKRFVDHVWRWADMDHAYFTMDLNFMESVLRVFKSLYNQNLVYKWFKTQWICPSCATTLANNEVNEWYKDRQDPAITIKFKINGSEDWREKDYEKHVMTNDWFVDVVAWVIKDWDKYLMIHHQKENLRFFPWGKVDKWESMEEALRRELNEEMWIEVINSKIIWTIKIIHQWKPRRVHYFDIDIKWNPSIQEGEKHTAMRRVEKVSDENNWLWFALKIDEAIITDKEELQRDFVDYRLFHSWIFTNKETENADLNVLAWTTTPRTLPSNMFLAVGEKIDYVQVFDVSSKEYYILAESLLKSYYKNPEEYIQVYRMKWEELKWLQYEPLFPYINQSSISDEYKKQFFKIIPWNFVSTEDGTWIVHIAPSFWMDDFEAVAAFLPREDAKNRLFLPVDDYGEFTDEVPDRKWIRVYETNKDVIQKLKESKKLIWQKSYEHSYPHCRRCETPLIQKAITSRFIKEQELTKKTVPNAENISFVPETVKNRFRDTLNSAPDRNLSRNRYRWSPLPIWENINNQEDKIVAGTLEELRRNTLEWSQNLTRNILIRHGRTPFNEENKHDCRGECGLTDLWKQEAELLKSELNLLIREDDESVIFISPLKRWRETILPYLSSKFWNEIKNIEKEYLVVQNKFYEIYDSGKFVEYIRDEKSEKRFEIWKNIFVDFRITELYIPEYQWVHFPHHMTLEKDINEKICPNGESISDVFDRVKSHILESNEEFKWKTIITISHGDPVVLMKKVFKDFDYRTKKEDVYPYNNSLERYENFWIQTRYRDNDRNTEVDLHKPYIDNYRFKRNGNEYRRITEVMDCWFESGSMPFGQVWYVGNEKNWKKMWSTGKPLIYPADFIIEWLDQTRGWFRTMHVLGNAVTDGNSFNNVIINWLILAEDGRKMSKSLKNYPEPKYIFDRYGTDAYRLYLLASPSVRAEPMRFSEKWVDQVFKDFTTAIINAYKFFETYANVDKRNTANTNVYFMRHAEAEWEAIADKLTEKWKKDMMKNSFIENVVSVNPDVIYVSKYLRNRETADRIIEIIKEYIWKDVEIKTEKWLVDDAVNSYKKILESEKWKNILIVWNFSTISQLWLEYYSSDKKIKIWNLEVINLPTYKITNELDKWILSALNQLGLEVDVAMWNYELDNAAKSVLGFIDKLNNRFIRRSRRRFRASGMNEDKISAYNTLFDVLNKYLHVVAPFAPFVSEYIYLKLQDFIIEWNNKPESIHLNNMPIFNENYIDEKLLEEVNMVRKIISLGLFIRSKNNIKVKQPLRKMEIRI